MLKKNSGGYSAVRMKGFYREEAFSQSVGSSKMEQTEKSLGGSVVEDEESNQSGTISIDLTSQAMKGVTCECTVA